MAVKKLKREPESSGFPYTMRFSDGRTVAVEIPRRMVVRDRGGEIAFTPAGVRFLDHLRALFMPLARPPSPAFLRSLREALGMSRRSFAEQAGVDDLTIARLEAGKTAPSRELIRSIEKIRVRARHRGVLLAG